MNGSLKTFFLGAFVQVAKEAILIITSRVPVDADGGVHQHMLSSMSPSLCHALMCATAPNLPEDEVEESVEFCKGIPLLVRRAGDALRAGQIVVQVRKEVRCLFGMIEGQKQLVLCAGLQLRKSILQCRVPVGEDHCKLC